MAKLITKGQYIIASEPFVRAARYIFNHISMYARPPFFRKWAGKSGLIQLGRARGVHRSMWCDNAPAAAEIG